MDDQLGDEGATLRGAMVSPGEQSAEVAIALSALGEQEQWFAAVKICPVDQARQGRRGGHRDGHLGAEDETWGGAGRRIGTRSRSNGHVGASRCVQPVAIGQRHGREPQGRGLVHELLGVTRALEHGAAALDPEGHIGGDLGHRVEDN